MIAMRFAQCWWEHQMSQESLTVLWSRSIRQLIARAFRHMRRSRSPLLRLRWLPVVWICKMRHSTCCTCFAAELIAVQVSQLAEGICAEKNFRYTSPSNSSVSVQLMQYAHRVNRSLIVTDISIDTPIPLSMTSSSSFCLTSISNRSLCK